MQASADEVTDALLAASTALVAVAARSLASAAEDVTLPQFRAMVAVALGGPLAVTELARELACSVSAASRLCDRLIAKDLMTRTMSAASRREVEVSLTSNGARLVSQVRRRRRREIATIVAAVPPSQRAAMVRALTAFADAAATESTARPAWTSGWEL